MSKPPAGTDRLLLSILKDSHQETPLETLRLAYRAGQASAASEFARKGGLARTAAKIAAVRENGKKGGRPYGAKDKHPRKRKSS